MPAALFILDDEIRRRVYPQQVYDAIAAEVDLIAEPMSDADARANPSVLRDMEILITSWSCPKIDAELLGNAPNLKAVFYGAGSVKSVVTEEMWQRGIRITHAADANAISVAQFTVGQILLSLKGVWREMERVKRERRFVDKSRDYPGLYRSRVGIIGLGLTGRHVCELLQPFDPEIVVFDPFAREATASELNANLVDLAELFATSQVVSLHAPWLPETEGMVAQSLLEKMPPFSTFINTARGALVCEKDLCAVLQMRPDLTALLDVTCPEPPARDSPLYDLPNVILTPHIAGAIGANDTRRLGELMLKELRSYLDKGEMRWEIKPDRLLTMA